MRFAILAAIATAVAAATPAGAGVVYQSIPDLTADPVINYCSPCTAALSQSIGQVFSLAATRNVASASFAVDSHAPYWPSTVRLGIYADGGGVVGANLFDQTFSSFVSDVPTAFNTDIVTVNLGSLSLTAGNYLIFLTGSPQLAIPVYLTGSGNMRFTQASIGAGVSYFPFQGFDTAVALFDTPAAGAVPEPSAWALLVGGLGLAGAALRRRRSATGARAPVASTS
jgi:hypothetical protein